MTRENKGFKFDWIIILLFLLLVGFGWVNITAASASGDINSYLDFSKPYGKQLLFILCSFFIIVIVLSLESKFYERFSSIIYLISIIALLGLFLFGKNVNGATSWYGLGSLTIQPSEFAKVGTALALAKFLSDLQTNFSTLKDQIRAIAIISLPAILIIMQNDTGSTLVYTTFIFIFIREGLPLNYILIAIGALLLSVLSLKFSAMPITIITICIVILHYFFIRKKKYQQLKYLTIVAFTFILTFGATFFYNSVLKTHQQNRISLWLRLEKNPDKLQKMKRTFAYNLIESEKAISSGQITGKGFRKGTRTTGKFVPEQHTDYIFTTVGEEWGFLGSALVVIIYVCLIVRIVILAELQKTQFARIYGYSVAAILFFHFTINIGMVMGLIPTIGIPLPFFSYGGSGLWAFTLLLFIFVKLDSNRINEW